MSALPGHAQASHQPPIRRAQLDWQDRAECFGLPTDLFFATDAARQNHAARHICNSCEVKTQCGEYAVMTGQQFGVWGGLTERELRRLQKAVS